MISAVLQSRLAEAQWDAEEARLAGDAEALLDALQREDEARTAQQQLSDPAWLRALETEM